MCSLFNIAVLASWLLADKTSTVLNISLSAFISCKGFPSCQIPELHKTEDGENLGSWYGNYLI